MSAAERARSLDARGLLCPLPVIRLQDAVRDLGDGDLLDVVATDPGVAHDIPAWCRLQGHRVVSARQAGPDFWFRIEARRGRGPSAAASG